MTTGLGTSATGRDPAARKAAYLGVGVTIALTGAVFAPILYHMVLHWKAVDDYSHGFLIAPLAIYFAWERRRKVGRARLETSWWGVVPLALGALSLMIGRLGVELMAMRVGFVPLPPPSPKPM